MSNSSPSSPSYSPSPTGSGIVFSGFMAVCLFLTMPLVAEATSTSTGSITLAWDANTEPDVAGYRVYGGDTSGSYELLRDVSQTTEAAVTNLEPGATYYFTVTAVNTAGLESDLSVAVTYTVPVDSTLPASALPITTGMQLSSGSGHFELSVSGEPGQWLDVWVSDDLKTWTLLKTVENTTGALVIVDEGVADPLVTRRFYRFSVAQPAGGSLPPGTL